MMKNGFAIAIAWPETTCKQAGAWYDRPMRWLGFNKNGYYKVGHAAVVLISDENPTAKYYDFGRYHAPKGFGRVRSEITDHELKINTPALIDQSTESILNLDEILSELFQNPSTHGTGVIYGSPIRINYEKALDKVNEMRSAEFIPYGPFIKNGSNCSRFVCSVIEKGLNTIRESIAYQLPLTLTPTPMWNLVATPNPKYCIGKVSKEKVPLIPENEAVVA